MKTFQKSGGAWGGTSFNSSKRTSRSGLRFARRVRLPRAVGLAGCSYRLLQRWFRTRRRAGGGCVGRLGVRLAAFSLADSEQGVDPLSREIYNLKTDAVLAGIG